jgi:hypothetical protein
VDFLALYDSVVSRVCSTITFAWRSRLTRWLLAHEEQAQAVLELLDGRASLATVEASVPAVGTLYAILTPILADLTNPAHETTIGDKSILLQLVADAGHPPAAFIEAVDVIDDALTLLRRFQIPPAAAAPATSPPAQPAATITLPAAPTAPANGASAAGTSATNPPATS